jgi:8-oxo-dGTP pyrophosphatase MutT (NUDIX family)
MSETYKPTGMPYALLARADSPDHDGLKQDGTPDKRVGSGESTHQAGGRADEAEFAQGKVDPHEAGKKGGQTGAAAGDAGDDAAHGHQKKGTSFHGTQRADSAEFAGGKVDPAEAGRQGGKSS